MRFDKMKGRLGVIYNGMWGEKDLPESVCIEPISDFEDSTYKIVGAKGGEKDAIKRAFMIKNDALFEKKYEKAVSGDGNESSKILTLHSSSRCSLLCFYGLDSEHTLTLKLDGEDVEFNFSTFEFKNPVIGYPSNMDVVLLSKNRDVVLFLESKFSEYYISATERSSHIGKRYEDNEFSSYFYKDEILNKFGLKKTSHTQMIKKKDGETVEREGFILETNNKSIVYLDGFKQMISHYIGIRRRLRGEKRDYLKADEDNKDAKTVLSVIQDTNSKVYLGEILFDKFGLPTGYENELSLDVALDNYSKMYSKLAEEINAKIKEDGLACKFRVLSQDLKYSDVMKNSTHIEDVTKEFYRVKG